LLDIEIARFGSDGVLHITRWIDEPIEIITKIGDDAITYSRGGVRYIDKLYLVGRNRQVEGIGKAIVLIRTIDYTTTSGIKLVAKSDKTTTILGRWIDDMQHIKTLFSVV